MILANYNKVILIGNLTRDPQVRQVGGKSIAEIGLAINNTWFDKASNSKKEDTTFVDVTLWGKTAELAGRYLTKGKSVMITGRLKLDTWDDKTTGQDRSRMTVVGEEMQFLGGGTQAARGGTQEAPSEPHVPDGTFPDSEVPF